uniref:Progonadoliberin n=1 Tax=Oncorhynchus mykiss TaxID=8022 RepID=A0A8C7S380_ONCMY
EMQYSLSILYSIGCCQHWSYGLNPGGERVTDSLSDTLDNVSTLPIHNMEIDTSCSLFGCADVSPHPEIYRLRVLLVSDIYNFEYTFPFMKLPRS